MKYRSEVASAAADLKLLDTGGNLIKLDSLGLLDLVAELETRVGIEIPTHEMRAETFATIETVSELLARLSSSSAAP
jgi:acyl carrier protein